MAKMRKLGAVLLDMEPLLDELAEQHDLQLGDILALVRHQLEMHNPDCIEEFMDGTKPVFFYGHQENKPKKENKYP